MPRASPRRIIFGRGEEELRILAKTRHQKKFHIVAIKRIHSRIRHFSGACSLTSSPYVDLGSNAQLLEVTSVRIGAIALFALVSKGTFTSGFD
jgi:hypothetical protein